MAPTQSISRLDALKAILAESRVDGDDDKEGELVGAAE